MGLADKTIAKASSNLSYEAELRAPLVLPKLLSLNQTDLSITHARDVSRDNESQIIEEG